MSSKSQQVPADTIISIRGLSKAYSIARNFERQSTLAETLLQRLRRPLAGLRTEQFWALSDVSLNINRGDVVGIIGRNGAGKSTLLKILSRIVEPTSGEVDLYGRVGSLLEVGTGFHPELTGRENIYLNGQVLGMRRDEIRRQFDAIVDFAGCEKFLETPVKRYSSGMYVRLAFAVAAHLNPEILVVDEVLAVGDAEFQKKCLGKMKDVAGTGRTVLFVSHNEAAVRNLCKSAVLLRGGRVAAIGTPEQAFQAYRARRTDNDFSTANRSASSPELELVDAWVSIDGARSTELANGCQPVLTFVVEVREPVKFSTELLLRDKDSTPVMFAPIGLTHGKEYQLPAGRHALSYKLKLPYLAAGRYTLDLMLAETCVRFYDCVEEALVLTVVPSNHQQTGWRFEQARGQGCMLMDVVEVN
jgi:lipopolysaccharide transport system ATP-binding protein